MAPPSTAPTSPTARPTNSVILVSSMAVSLRPQEQVLSMREPTARRDGIPPYRYGIPAVVLDSELGGSADEFGLGADAELGVDGHQVTLDRALAHEQPLGDFLCRLAP